MTPKALSRVCMLRPELALCAALLAFPSCKAESERPAESQASSAAESAPVELSVGERAPKVTLSLQNGKTLSFADLKGKPVVLYFYPKDDTPGCTVEAQGLRDAHAEFEKAGARVLGVSTQGAQSHQSFIEKHELPFDLVVDEEGKVARAFGVPVKNGKAARQTFLVDSEGKLAKIWRDVEVGTHAQEILAALPRK